MTLSLVVFCCVMIRALSLVLLDFVPGSAERGDGLTRTGQALAGAPGASAGCCCVPRLFIEGGRRAAPACPAFTRRRVGKGEKRPLGECGRLTSSQTGRHLDASASGNRGENVGAHGSIASEGDVGCYETGGLHAVVPFRRFFLRGQTMTAKQLIACRG